MKKNTVLYQLLGTFLVSIGYMILLILAQLSFQVTTENTNLRYLISLIMAIIFPTIIFYLNKKYFNYLQLSPPNLVNINLDFLKKIVVGLFFGLIALFFTSIISFFISDNIDSFIFKIHFPLMIFNLITAIGEELIFRGTFLNIFVQKNQKYLGLIFSSILFALIHLLNVFMGQEVTFIQILELFLAGLFLGLIYINFGLLSSISSHYIWNLLNAGANFTDADIVVPIVLAFICVILIIKSLRNQVFVNE